MSAPNRSSTDSTYIVPVSLSPCLDRPVEVELLVHLDDLHGLHADVDVLEEMPLDHHREDRHEGQRRDQRVVTEFGGGGLVVSGRVDRP